jgi:glycosyltransferase involved in cell wall biosynthesis
MSDRALVSVVIPTYNRAHSLSRAVDSVLGQTHGDVEILLVDDGSKDDTPELVKERYGSERRVRYLRQENTGVSGARNHGLREATGDFVALLDSDDEWLPWKLEAQLACFRALPHVGMVWTDMMAVDETGKVLYPRFLTEMYSAYGWFDSREDLFDDSRPFAELAPELAAKIGEPRVYWGEIFSQMVLGNLVHTSTVLLRRERADKVKAFDTRLRRSGEDYDFHLRTCREGPVAYLDAVAIRYLTGASDQLTARGYEIDMAKNFLATITPVLERDRDRIRLPKAMIDEVLAEAHSWIGMCHYERGERAEARNQLAQSLRHRKNQPRVAAFLALSMLPAGVAEGARSLLRLRGSKQAAP